MTRTISIKSYSRLLFAVRKSFSFAALRLRYWLPHTATAWGPAVPSCSAREVLITHRGWILNPCLCKGGFPLTSHTVAAHNLCLWGGEQWNPVKPHIFSFRPFTIGASISTPLITIGSGRPPCWGGHNTWEARPTKRSHYSGESLCELLGGIRPHITQSIGVIPKLRW